MESTAGDNFEEHNDSYDSRLDFVCKVVRVLVYFYTEIVI